MILSDKRILEEIDKGHIIIEPFNRECLGTNSYDVHLGKHLATYRNRVLDAKLHNEVLDVDTREGLFALQPNTLYLAIMTEYTETRRHVPLLQPNASDRYILIEGTACAGKGDVGFCNTW